MPPTTLNSEEPDNLAQRDHADVQQAQAEQRCTRYSSDALDGRALH